MRPATSMGATWLRVAAATLVVLAGLAGLAAGFSFGLEAGGGYALAIVAGLCLGALCTLTVDTWVDTWVGAWVDRAPRLRSHD